MPCYGVLMNAIQIAARVTDVGLLELAEPLPAEFRARHVDVVVFDQTGEKYDPWQLMALRAFFAGYDDADSIYDELDGVAVSP